MAFEQLHTRVCNTSVARLSFTILIVTQQQSREINLYDADGNLVDRLTYGDNTLSGSIRAQNNSGNPESLDVLGTNDALGWVSASAGDEYGSYVAANCGRRGKARDAYVLTYTAGGSVSHSEPRVSIARLDRR